GLERDERARRPGGVADRDVQLVGRHDSQLRIADFPPPLVPHHRDLERVAGGRRPLDREDVPGRRQEQDDHDEKGHDGPRQLDLRAAVHLRRIDRKSTRLNSSHVSISYAVFCLKKKKLLSLTHESIYTLTYTTHYTSRTLHLY